MNELYEERDPVLAFFIEPIVAAVWTIDLLGSFAADTACLVLTVPGELLTRRRIEMPGGDDRKLRNERPPKRILVHLQPMPNDGILRSDKGEQSRR